MSRVDLTYPITLAQLQALADFICLVDQPPFNEACGQAHRIIAEVLGPDESIVYCPTDGSKEEAA